MKTHNARYKLRVTILEDEETYNKADRIPQNVFIGDAHEHKNANEDDEGEQTKWTIKATISLNSFVRRYLP